MLAMTEENSSWESTKFGEYSRLLLINFRTAPRKWSHWSRHCGCGRSFQLSTLSNTSSTTPWRDWCARRSSEGKVWKGKENEIHNKIKSNRENYNYIHFSWTGDHCSNLSIGRCWYGSLWRGETEVEREEYAECRDRLLFRLQNWSVQHSIATVHFTFIWTLNYFIEFGFAWLILRLGNYWSERYASWGREGKVLFSWMFNGPIINSTNVDLNIFNTLNVHTEFPLTTSLWINYNEWKSIASAKKVRRNGDGLLLSTDGMGVEMGIIFGWKTCQKSS